VRSKKSIRQPEIAIGFLDMAIQQFERIVQIWIFAIKAH